MSREIKFRAWSIKDKKMIINSTRYISFHGTIEGGNEFYKLMQFTGVKDKNGIDIYEGDIIKISEVLDKIDVITDVYFKKSAFRYRHSDGSGSVLPEFTSKINGYPHIRSIEVIGNIYEDKIKH